MIRRNTKSRGMLFAAIAAGLGVSTTTASQAATVAYWTFDAGTVAVASGTGTLTHNFPSGDVAFPSSGTSVNLVGTAGNPNKALSLTSKGNNNDIITLAASTAGKSDIWFSYATSADVGSFTTQTIAFSTDGTTFTNLGTFAPTTGYSTATFSLASIAAFNNDANAKLRITFTGAGSGNNKVNLLDNIQINAGNDSVIAGPASSPAFGRLMKGQTPSLTVALTKTGLLGTTYTLTPVAGVSATGDGSIAEGGQTENITVALTNVAAGSGSVGTKSLSVVVDNTAATSYLANLGSLDANKTINISATVVDNRVITAGSVGAPMAFGKLLVGQSKTLAGQSLGSPASNSVATTITLNAGGGSTLDGNLAMGNGSAVTFDGTTTNTTRSFTGNFTKSGQYIATSSTISGVTSKTENLTGEVLQPLSVVYSADVYQAAQLTANTGSNVVNGGSLTLTNAAPEVNGQRAAARITGASLTGNTAWSVSNLSVGTVIAQNSTATGIATLNTAGLLNGNHKAKLTLTLEHDDQSILGTADDDLGTIQWTLKQTVSGNSGSAVAKVLKGESFAGYNTHRGNGRDTKVELLNGNANASIDRTISLDFADAGSNFSLMSDVVELSGTVTDRFVLQLTYNDAAVWWGREDQLVLGWLNPATSKWMNAIAGNSDGGIASHFVSGAYNGSLTLGDWGIDITNNNVWAVLDHNSDFAVLTTAVPEPTGLAIAGMIGLSLSRRRRKFNCSTK